MRGLILLGGLATLALFASRSSGSSPAKPSSGDCVGNGSLFVQGRSIRYVQVMTGGASPSSPVPVLIFLHSRGTTPEAYVRYAQRLTRPARVVLPEGPTVAGGGRSWFTARAADADQTTLASQMQWTATLLAAFVAALRSCVPGRRVDGFTGFSQGASLAYAMSADRVGPSVGISGWLPQPLWSAQTLPVTAIHGFTDDTVAYAPTALWAAEMVVAGAPVHIVGLPGGHSPTAAMLSAWQKETEAMIA